MAYSVVGTNNYMSVRVSLASIAIAEAHDAGNLVTGRSKFCEGKDMEFIQIGGGELLPLSLNLNRLILIIHSHRCSLGVIMVRRIVVESV